MRKRVRCTRHYEKTASVVIYGDYGFCFGCHQKIPVEELGIERVEHEEHQSYKEDLDSTLAYIASLPTKSIRGFELPFSDRGYYLVYPCRSFYKFRDMDTEAKSKYRGPAGHTKPWFVAALHQQTSVAVVEGEFNALSLAAAVPELDVVSPGGAGDFYSNTADKNLHKLTIYEKIYIVVDDDAAGVKALMMAMSKLYAIGFTNIVPIRMEKDFNEIHQEKGIEAVRDEARRLGMLQQELQTGDAVQALRRKV